MGLSQLGDTELLKPSFTEVLGEVIVTQFS